MTDGDEATVELANGATAHAIAAYARARGMDPLAIARRVDADPVLDQLAMRWAEVPTCVENAAERLAAEQGIDSGAVLMAHADIALTAAQQGRRVMAAAMLNRIGELVTES